MDFWGAVQVLRRRWYVVLGAFAGSIAIAVGTYVLLPTHYASTGVVVLTSPAAGAKFSESTKPEDVERINPLLAFDGSLTTSAEIIGQVLRDPATADELGAGAGAPATYQVANGDATISGPFIFVTVDGTSAPATQDLVKRVLDRAASELRDRQRAVNAPESTYIQVDVLVKPTVPEPQINGKIRFAGAALALTLIASLAATFAFDNIASSRRRRRPDDVFGGGELAAPTPASALGQSGLGPTGDARVGSASTNGVAVHHEVAAAAPPPDPGLTAIPVQVAEARPATNGHPTTTAAASPRPAPSAGRPAPRRPSPGHRPSPVVRRPSPVGETVQLPGVRSASMNESGESDTSAAEKSG